jgi:hypothetical protein
LLKQTNDFVDKAWDMKHFKRSPTFANG